MEMPRTEKRWERRVATWGSRPLNVPRLPRGTLGEQLSDNIRHRIQLGDVKPGQRLESMRELAAQAGVSLGVVREAIAELRAAGLVTVRPGAGTFVVRKMGRARSLKAARRRMNATEARDLRWAVEPILAERAAQRASDEQRQDLFLWVHERRWGRESGNPDLFIRRDLEFHDALARASRSTLGAATHRMARWYCAEEMRLRARTLARHPDLDRLHSDLADAVLDARPDRAAELARKITEIEGGQRSGP